MHVCVGNGVLGEGGGGGMCGCVCVCVCLPDSVCVCVLVCVTGRDLATGSTTVTSRYPSHITPLRCRV